MPSGQRAKYGRVVEEICAREYGIAREGHHSSFADGKDPRGRPVEIKGAVLRRKAKSNGRRYPGYFQIRGEGHEKLRSHPQSSYIFAVFDRSSDAVKASRRVPASRVDRILARDGFQGHGDGDGLASVRWDRVIDPSSV